MAGEATGSVESGLASGHIGRVRVPTGQLRRVSLAALSGSLLVLVCGLHGTSLILAGALDVALEVFRAAAG